MSSLLFPSLPGVQIEVQREAVDDVDVQPTLGGKETRFTESTYQRIRYSFNYDLLRSSLANREFQQLVTHFTRHRGRLDSFLVTDDEDKSVTDMGFAVGDGSTASFQLQRTLGGDITDTSGFLSKAASKPRTNWCALSQQFDSWSTHGGGSVNGYSAPLANADFAPDGTATADVIVTSGSTPGNSFGIFLDTGTPFAGAYTFSIWLRAGTAASAQIFIKDGATDSVRATATCALTSSWQRFTVTGTTLGTVGSGTRIEIQVNVATGTISAWGAQLDAGSNATPYIATAGSTVTANPKYWPQIGDGFEPIFDLNFAAPLAIYADGDWRGRRQLFPWSRTNQQTFSEQFDNAAWTKQQATITANAVAAPDGTTTADKLVEDSTTNIHRVFGTGFGTTSGLPYVGSVYVKAAGRSRVRVSLGSTGFAGAPVAIFDLTAISVVSGPGTIAALANGWFRVSVSATAVATGAGQGALVIDLDNGSTNSYLGDGGSGVYLWGAQAEIATAVTEYISTPSSFGVSKTDYTLSSLGVVTPATVLPAGAFLSADMSYYRRVRFENDNLGTDRIVSSMWSAQSVSLISVKP